MKYNTTTPSIHKFTYEEFCDDNAEELQHLYHDADERLSPSDMCKQIFNTSNRNSSIYHNLVWEVDLATIS